MASLQWRVARKRDPRAERPCTPIGPQTPWTQRSCHFGPCRRVIRHTKNVLHTSIFRHAFASLHAKSNYSRLPRALFAKGTHAYAAKSNHSRTSAKYTRKSNYSRTYAKTGGWGCLMSELSVPSDQGSGSKKKADHPPVFSGSSLATRHSPLTLIITAALATAAQRVVPIPIFTTTLSIDVGAPTISLSRATEDKLKN